MPDASTPSRFHVWYAENNSIAVHVDRLCETVMFTPDPEDAEISFAETLQLIAWLKEVIIGRS